MTNEELMQKLQKVEAELNEIYQEIRKWEMDEPSAVRAKVQIAETIIKVCSTYHIIEDKMVVDKNQLKLAI